jgi:hypothetical protein
LGKPHIFHQKLRFSLLGRLAGCTNWHMNFVERI